MSTGLEIGKTGIRTAQQAMLTAGNNIANANTPGFSKRTPILTAESPIKDPSGFFIGRGVKMADIRRETAEFLTIRLFEKQAALSNAEARNIRLADLEGLFNELSEFSLKNTISDFFGSIHEVSKAPDSLSVRTQMVETANIVTQTFNQMDNDINDMLTRVRDDIKTTVKEVNNITLQIADLNVKIASLSISSVASPGELEDQRDVLLNDLSKLLDANVKLSGDGVTKNVSFGGREIVGGGNVLLLSTDTDALGNVSVTFKSDNVTANPLSGELKGLVDFQTDANVYKSELDKLAKAVIDEFNRIHSEGIKLGGSYDSIIKGANGISDANLPLDTPNLLPFTPSSGNIYVTVTNIATGEVTKTSVAVDVTSATLTTLVSDLNSNVANIDPTITTTGSNSFLNIAPDPGFTVDFSASIDPNPDLTSFTGASVTMGGSYTGSDNDSYTFTVLGTGGTIGQTAGLQIEVRDSSSTLLQTIEVGDNYVPGTTIDIIDGIKMTLSNGVISGGDSFSTVVLYDPDETNLLSAFGLNSFFTGNSANTISVHSDIMNDASLIAASSNSEGDNTNILRMADLEFKKINNNNTIAGRSFGEFLTETAAQIGSESRLSEITMATERGAYESLKNLKEQIVGVSIDEELANLLKFEQMYNASARFISVVNDAIDRILQI